MAFEFAEMAIISRNSATMTLELISRVTVFMLAFLVNEFTNNFLLIIIIIVH